MCNFFFFFFNDTATTEIYTLSLHDALPIYTEARLRAATSEQEARAALQRFVDVFGDGHLTIEWPKPEAPSATPPASSLCARLGYRRPSSPGIDFSQVAGFTPLGAEPFPHGLLRLGRRTVGGLRIAPF